VLDEKGQVVRELTPAGAEELAGRGVASGGMLAKLRASTSALRQGVPEVAIAAGAGPRILAQLLAGGAVGTRMTAGTGAEGR